MRGARPFRVVGISVGRWNDSYPLGSFATFVAADTRAMAAIATCSAAPSPSGVVNSWVWREVWLHGAPVARVYVREEGEKRILIYEQPRAKRVKGPRGAACFEGQARRLIGESTFTPVRATR